LPADARVSLKEQSELLHATHQQFKVVWSIFSNFFTVSTSIVVFQVLGAGGNGELEEKIGWTESVRPLLGLGDYGLAKVKH
jgi:hypothetical protein